MSWKISSFSFHGSRYWDCIQHGFGWVHAAALGAGTFCTGPGVEGQINGDFLVASSMSSMLFLFHRSMYGPCKNDTFAVLILFFWLINVGYKWRAIILCASYICHTWIVLVGRKQFHCFMPEKEMWPCAKRWVWNSHLPIIQHLLQSVEVKLRVLRCLKWFIPLAICKYLFNIYVQYTQPVGGSRWWLTTFSISPCVSFALMLGATITPSNLRSW